MLPVAATAVLALIPTPDLRVPIDLRTRVQQVTALQIWAEQLRREGVGLREGMRLPQGAKQLRWMGTTVREGERLDEALAAFNASLVLRPDNPDAIVGRAKTHALLGRCDAAEADYARLLALEPHNPQFWQMVAEGWIAREKFTEARQCFDRARGLSGPGKWQVDVVVVEALRWLGLSPSVETQVGKPVSGSQWNALHGVSPERRFWAKQALADAVALDTDGVWCSRAVLRLHRGMLLLVDGRSADARDEFDAGLKLAPDNADLHLGRAEACLRLADMKEAVISLEAAERCGCSQPAADFTRGQIHLTGHEYEAAAKAFAKCCEVGPENAEVYHLHALALRMAGSDDEADRVGRRAAALGGWCELDELIGQSMSFMTLGQPASVDRLLTRAIEQPSWSKRQRAKLFATRGLVRGGTGRSEEAFDDLTAAVRLDPGHHIYRGQRAHHAIFMRRMAAAAEDADAYFRLMHHDSSAHNNLQRVRSDIEVGAAIAGRAPDFRPAGPVVRVPITVSYARVWVEQHLNP